MKTTHTTLGTVIKDGKILLGLKKRGFGKDRWNGFGGKIEAGETVAEAFVRECSEECGITPKEFIKLGVLTFKYVADDEEKVIVHLFKIKNFEGELVETEEMRPKWFPIDKIPFELMWPDDPYWMDFFIGDIKFKADFLFEGYSKIVEYNISAI